MNRFKILFLAAVSFFIFSSCVTLEEKWFLYPEKYKDLPLKSGKDMKAEEVSLATEKGIVLKGIFIDHKNSRDTLVYFYGNRESIRKASKRLYFIAEEFAVNVLCFDYREYGLSSGKTSFGALVYDAPYIFDFAKERSERIFLFGQSLGTVQTTVIGSKRSPDGIIMEAPFTSAKEAVPAMTEGLWPPFNVIIRLKADKNLLTMSGQPVERMKGITAPLLVLHGENDPVFPCRLGRKMYEAAASEEKNFCLLENTNHDNVNIFSGPAYECIKAFLEKHR
ncbi:MAG: alpha/beta hydrolase [Candidatus Goldiibacteriota bacterium]